MKLTMIGHAAFWIQEPVTVVMDPFDSDVSSIFPEIVADVVTESHQHFDHRAHDRVKGDYVLCQSADSVQLPGITVQGFPSFHDKEFGKKRGGNILFKFTFEDGLTLLHSGDLGHIPDNDIVKKIGTIDVLLIPTGGTYTLNASEALITVDLLRPSVVIPMHYRSALMNSLAPLEEFTGLFGKNVETKETLIVTKKNLPKEDNVCVVLTPLVKKK